jgi:dTDP-4-dehydrorhamnose reductase
VVPPVTGPILVTGGTGQVATCLAEQGQDVLRVGRPDFDFDAPEAITPLLERLQPRLVVNAAAYTAVDKAESEPEAAARANAGGPGLIAAWCAQAGVPLIHISTDYVFDGAKGAPYLETDTPNPIGIYGATKREGERIVLGLHPQAIILRTSWVYAAQGKNFVRTMLGAARKTDRLRVVADQIGCPTDAHDLAAAILAIAARIAAGGMQPGYAGITHAAGSGFTSWHGLACEVFAAAGPLGHTVPIVEPIATADWPTPVSRPADSRLDCTRLASIFGLRLPEWQSSVHRTVARIIRDDSSHAAARPPA